MCVCVSERDRERQLDRYIKRGKEREREEGRERGREREAYLVVSPLLLLNTGSLKWWC